MFIKKEKGFTIIEVLVVIGIMGLILIFVSRAFFQSVNNAKLGDKMVSAEYKKFIIYKALSQDLFNLNPEKEFEFEQYRQVGLSKIYFKGKIKGNQYFSIAFETFSPDASTAGKNIIYSIETPLLIRDVDGDAHTISSDLREAYFAYENGNIVIAGDIVEMKEDKKGEIVIPFRFVIDINKKYAEVELE